MNAAMVAIMFSLIRSLIVNIITIHYRENWGFTDRIAREILLKYQSIPKNNQLNVLKYLPETN